MVFSLSQSLVGYTNAAKDRVVARGTVSEICRLIVGRFNNAIAVTTSSRPVPSASELRSIPPVH